MPSDRYGYRTDGDDEPPFFSSLIGAKAYRMAMRNPSTVCLVGPPDSVHWYAGLHSDFSMMHDGELYAPHTLSRQGAVNDVVQHLINVETLHVDAQREVVAVSNKVLKKVRLRLQASAASVLMSPRLYETVKATMHFSKKVLRKHYENSQEKAPILRLPNEVLIKILTMLDQNAAEDMEQPTTAYECLSMDPWTYTSRTPLTLPSPSVSPSFGAAALALTCKHFAELSKGLEITKTTGFAQLMGWIENNKFFCTSCASVYHQPGPEHVDLGPQLAMFNDLMSLNSTLRMSEINLLQHQANYAFKSAERRRLAPSESSNGSGGQTSTSGSFLCSECRVHMIWLRAVTLQKLERNADYHNRQLHRRRLAMDTYVLKAALPHHFD